MRAFFTFAILFSCLSIALAQPPNDECTGATNLSLSTPPACPGGGSVTNTFGATNVNATSTVPYPSFTGCNPGGATDSPAAEVWFTFTATSNNIDISITGGLSTPNLVLFTGPSCVALNAIACAKAPAGSGELSANFNLIEGQTYYLLISGGSVNDQGNFNITIQSSRDCDPCLNADNLVASPPPLNGTYATGTNVQFCYTVLQWDVTGTVEWFHAIDIQFGPGWDLSTLTPTVIPPSCDGNGNWGFYNSWTSSNTGQTYGPGFAYDSNCTSAPPNPGACTPIPLDGNPGNNWGDGGGNCAGIGTTAPPVTFCWEVMVDFSAPTGTDLSVIVTPLSDGDSGGWVQTGCNSGNSNTFLASVTNCNDLDPIALVLQQPTCPGADDGSVQISANGGILTGSWVYRVFDAVNNLVVEVDATSFPAVVNNLEAGNYSVQAINALSGCTRSTNFTLVADPAPTAIPDFNPACPGTPIQLLGSTDGFGAMVSYFWTGPPGFPASNLQNPTTTIEGMYTLVVTVDGCQSDPVTINVQYENYFVSASANPTQVCPNSMVTLTANGNVDSYSWTDGFGTPVGVGPTIQVLVQTTTTYTVTGQSAAGCSVTSMVTVNTFAPPVPNIIAPNAACEGLPIILDLSGGPFNQYLWSDASSSAPPRVLDLDPGNYTYSVTVTDFNGCVGASVPVSFTVSPLPNVSISPSLPVICSGESVTLTASGANSYSWSNNTSGNSITVSPTMNTTYTVTGVSVDNCQNTASVTVVVDEEADPPMVSCGDATPNSVEFEFDATGYTVDVLTNQMGTLSGTTFTVDGLSPGEDVTIEVTASSNNSCPDVSTTFTCTSQDCPEVGVEITPVADICLATDSPLDTLELTLTDEMDGDTLWSGPGIVDEMLGVFDPMEADTGLHEIVVLYTEGDCVYSDTIEIAVFEIPTADFTVSNDNICVGDSITISYTGTADTMSNFNWSFNGGGANPGTGIGSHNIAWSTAGTKTITLVVEENGCFSEPFSVEVEVAAPLPDPVISCTSTSTTSVEFTWPEITGATGYTVNVLTAQNGTQNNNSFLVTGLLPGEEVTIEVIAETDNPCGTSSAQSSCTADPCPAFNINISPVTDLCLDGTTSAFDLNATVSGGQGNGTRSWSGPGIIDGMAGTFHPDSAGVGMHTITLTYVEGPCSGMDDVVINVFEVPTADFAIADDAICIGQATTITYAGTASSGASYTWGFNGGTADPGTGAGPHEVSWNTAGTKTVTLSVEENGCTSTVFSETVEVVSPMADPVISCGMTTTTSVEFTWTDVPGATDYTINILTGQSGTPSGNSFLVENLSPGELVTIEIIANSNNPCGNTSATFDCSADDCPNLNVTIEPVADICLDETNSSFDLTANVTGGGGTGSLTWDGPGITDMANGTFDPQMAGAGMHTITVVYDEMPCSASDDIIINVFDTPTADFTIDPAVVCIGEETTIIFDGQAGAGANYTWNFNGGDAQPGTGEGPHTVSWSTAGTKTVTLIVEENNCTSTQFSQTVEVQAPLAAPVINCNTSTSSIEFGWQDIPGADSYNVTVITNQTGTLSGTTFTVDNLSPGETVTIEVEAVGTGPCGNSTNNATCFAEDCPMVTIDLDPVDPICLDDSAVPVTLNATLTGAMGTGTETWSGNGITDQMAGIFDPEAAMVGDHTINYTYQEGNCTYNASMVIVVNEQPSAEFSVDDLICVDASSTILYTGAASGGATYEWDFDGGTADPGTGQGPHEVTWPDSGMKTITLTVTENDCASEVFMQTVQVDAPLEAPVVNCSTTNTSITFTWNDVPGADSYQVVDITGPAGTLNGNSYEVTGLDPGDAVTIEVIAEGATICGTSSTEETCVAQDCPDFVFDIEPITDLCADAGLQNFVATVTGGAGNGTLTWSGNGITEDIGTFDPAMAMSGANTLTISYTEGVCTEDTTVTVTVFDVPTADFTATGPICSTGSALVTYTGTASAGATYNWDFAGGIADPGTGAGPHTVTWATAGAKTITLTVEENGCSSTEVTQTVQVDEPLAVPQVACETTQTSITFTWEEVPGATGYSIIEVFGPTGVLEDTSYTVSGLMPDDEVILQVVAEGDGACGNATSEEVSCTANSCEDVTFNIAPDMTFCGDDEPATLAVSVNGGMGNGTFTWSGDGIADPSGVFDPSEVNPGDITLSVNYEEGACAYDTSIVVVVFEVPTADFTVAGPICITETATVTYTGNAASTATYTWDFDGGTAMPGDGQGPQTVSWSTGGMKTITLTVEENGCTSTSFTQTIQVDEVLTDPVISCTTDNTFIIFEWEEVLGATGYQVNVLTGQNGELDGTTFTVENLNPGDEVTIQVIAEGDGACGNSIAEETCIAAVCPEISFQVDPVSDLCADDDVQTLSATVTGGVGEGTFTWSGPGITDPAGLFDPSEVLPGDISLNLEYVEGVCSYDTTIMVTVFALPTADFTVTSPICVENTATITYTGSAGANATYNWDFDGGMATPGTGQGPHEVSWPDGGTKTIALTVVENGCTSLPVTQEVEVAEPLAEPVVTCAETTSTSIVFSWEEVPGATGYEVEVLDNGPTGTVDGNTYILTDLTPQQSVTIQVTALGDGPCGNSVGTGTCVAQDCPMVALVVSGPDVICSGSDADFTFDFSGGSDGPFTVLYTLNGGAELSAEVSDGSVITLSELTETTNLEVQSIQDNSLPDCVFPGNASWEVTVNEPVEAGTALAAPEICVGTDSMVTLADLLENATPGGQWVETSANPSTGGAFVPATGEFNPVAQGAGTYTFSYQVTGPAPCPDAAVEVEVVVVPSPVADAGQDQELTCNMGMVSLGGANTTDAVSFMWTADDEDIMIANPQSQFIDASQPGTYTFTVTNAQGCTATDEVEVTTNFDVPVAEVSISQISCFEADDGGIFIDNVTGGVGPYEFSLNGGAFTTQMAFTPLGPDNYSLVIQDQNGCFSELTVDLSQPEELFVELTTNLEGNDNLIRLGDSVRLQATYNQSAVLDTIIWQPDSVAMGNTSSIWVSPATTSNYSVTIIDENGCSDSDDMTIFVRKDRPVYFPNVFSPNDDGNNDVFYIQTGSNVRQVRSFLIFNRWGETIMELNGFQANDPSLGWDGTFRGQPMNSGVYTYFAEVEFEDGIIMLYKGDITLLR